MNQVKCTYLLLIYLVCTQLYAYPFNIQQDVNESTYLESGSITYHYDGSIYGGLLTRDLALTVGENKDSVWFLAGEMVQFYPSGIIQKGILKHDTEVGGIIYKAETAISFFQNGRVLSGFVVEDFIWEEMEFPAGSLIAYFEHGDIWYVDLAQDAEINGYEYAAGEVLEFKQREVIVKKEEQLESVPTSLEEPGEFEGDVAYDDIQLQEKIVVDTLVLIQDIEDQIAVLDDGNIAYHANGNVLESTLLYDVRVPLNTDTITLQGGGPIQFYENGLIESGVLATTSQVDSIKYLGGERITLFENKKVSAGYLAEELVVNEWQFPAQSFINFYESGNIWYVDLADSLKTSDMQYGPGEVIEFEDQKQEISQNQKQIMPDYVVFNGLDQFDTLLLDANTVLYQGNGDILEGELMKDILIVSGSDSVYFAKGHVLTFWEGIVIESGMLLRPTNWNQITFKQNTIFSLHENGFPQSGYIQDDLELENGIIPAGSLVVFHDYGDIWYIELAADTTYDQVKYVKGQSIEVHEYKEGRMALD